MEKNCFLISVSGSDGYSFAVCGDFSDDEAIGKALEAGLFQDKQDAEYAVVDFMTEREIKRYEDCGCMFSI